MAMNGIYKLREELHNKLLILRSMEAIVMHPRFEQLWDDSTSIQKVEVSGYTESLDKKKLIEWMKNHSSLELGEMSLARLRIKAKELCIKDYSRLSKELLIFLIEREQEHDKI